MRAPGEGACAGVQLASGPAQPGIERMLSSTTRRARTSAAVIRHETPIAAALAWLRVASQRRMARSMVKIRRQMRATQASEVRPRPCRAGHQGRLDRSRPKGCQRYDRPRRDRVEPARPSSF